MGNQQSSWIRYHETGVHYYVSYQVVIVLWCDG